MVLYDGGKHAEEVGLPSVSLFILTQNSQMRRRSNAALVSTGPRENAANCPPLEALRSPLLLEREFKGRPRRSVLCYASLRNATHYERRPALLWPGRLVTGLRGSVHGREQGVGEGVWTVYRTVDPILDAPSNLPVSGQSCIVCGGRLSHGRAGRSRTSRVQCGGQLEKELQHIRRTAKVGEVRGARLGEAVAASRRGP